MGIIKKTLSVKPERTPVTIIAQGNSFIGDVTAIGRMHIDGDFEGNIVSRDGVSIGRHGRVQGVIRAPQVNVSGTFEGELHCNEVHIESGGQAHGLLVCHKMSIDSEGTFVGERRTVEHVVSDTPASSAIPKDLVSDMIDTLPDKIVLTMDD